MELLKQGQYSPLTMSEQVLSLFAAKFGYLKDVKVEKVGEFEKFMHTYFKNNHADLIATIEEKAIISDELKAQINDAMTACAKEYKVVYGA